MGDPRIGITLFAPIKNLSFGAKPKPIIRSKLPGVVTTDKALPVCKARGKGQKCSMKPFEAFLLKANKNIETLQDMVEKTSNDFISCWENAKELISQYERTNKDLEKQFQATKKQLVVLEDKASTKTRQLEYTARDLKREKQLTKALERNSKGVELEADRKMKKVEGERDRKIKQLESDRDKWKERADKLSSDLQDLKTSVLNKKPSAVDLLILKQEEMNIKHNMKIKNDLHTLELKRMEEERKSKVKDQRLHSFYRNTGGKWSLSIMERMVWKMCHCVFENLNSPAMSHYYYCIAL